MRGEIKLIVAIRGATTVNDNTLEEISSKTVELLTEVMVRNQLSERDLISIIFTMTDDLNAYYPAAAVREAGLIKNTPLMCVQESKVLGSLPLCIRLLVHCQSTKLTKDTVKHVYLNEAHKLRPDLVD